MCGILALLNRTAIDDDTLKLLVELVDSRGPDYSSEVIKRNTKCGIKLEFKSSVLHLRGPELQEQPLTDCDRNVLLFNGQIYSFDGYPLDKNHSDTRFLSEKLSSCETAKEIAMCLSKITGPFAVVYWQERLNSLFYGRDLFGRKSLCLLLDTNNRPILLSSVGCQQLRRKTSAWIEIDCCGIHCIDLGRSDSPRFSLFTRDIESVYHKTAKCRTETTVSCETERVYLGPSSLKPISRDIRCWEDFTAMEHKLALKDFEELLIESISKRIQYNRPDCLICRKVSEQSTTSNCNHSKVAIAFSGGIDSTVLAFAIDRLLEEKETIDLVTVSFRDNAPDRISVQDAVLELIKIRPLRNWRLIICDISKEELQRERESIIKHLINPCDTVVDDSLGCGCWFIGRAKGRAIDSCSVTHVGLELRYDEFCKYNPQMEVKELIEEADFNYESPASMMFVGTGIDEQLGGYSSHRAAWTSSGPKGIYDEISFQMRRISTRNLGRDDRVYSYHGRDLKMPYLDETLVSFLNQLPIGLKMDLSKKLDTGPKLLIRHLAMEWGLKKTAHRIKRALQFGTKIANLENTREKGNDQCSRLMSYI